MNCMRCMISRSFLEVVCSHFKANMETMSQNLKTEEMFNKLLRKIDYLIKVQVLFALKVLDFDHKMCLLI